MITIDFETKAITGNPIVIPPEPIGVAIKINGEPSEYLPMCRDVRKLLAEAVATGEPLLFHNAWFDLRVMEDWLMVDPPEWQRIHDTQYMLYLHDPHSPSLALKESAIRLLEYPADERDELKEWVLANVKRATKKSWGAYISDAPEHLVSKYACADVDMTYALYRHLVDKVPKKAYDRERALAPHLVAATRRGIRVATEPLGEALERCERSLAAAEGMLRKRLNAPDLNPHSGAELADALDKAGVIGEDQWTMTPTGRRSTARKSLLSAVQDVELVKILTYCSAMQTCTSTFMSPWIVKSAYNSRLHPNWNQIRSYAGGKGKGTRTGRLSSDDPNFQNVPTPFTFEVPEGLEPMPNMRSFLLPEEGEVWISRDFSAQEMRLLAHFEQGRLCEEFNKNPDLDPHAMVATMIKESTGKTISRKHVKNIGFGIMYGMGARSLAASMGVKVGEAQEMIEAYLRALPGVRKLQAGTRMRGRNNRPIRTWGGREYHVEKPKLVGGSYRSFEYKLLNYLIQGSAADQTKQCLLDWFEDHPAQSTFLATVHDEINISSNPDDVGYCSQILKMHMEANMFSVPMLTTEEIGPNWGDIA